MSLERRPSPGWPDARRLLGSFDGASSQIFVIDLPESHWPNVVERTARIPRLQVAVDGRDGCVPSGPVDAAMLDRMRAPDDADRWFVLQADALGLGRVQIHLWPPHEAESLDVQIVFWSDQAFPSGATEEDAAERFGILVELAESFRKGAEHARCILASEHNGDPREILGCPGSLVW